MSKKSNWKSKYEALSARRFGVKGFRSLLIDGSIKWICVKITFPLSVIYIDPRLSYKEKLMILAHEYGHLLRFNEYGILQETFEMAKESEANKTAIKILKQYGVSKREYLKFYNKHLF